MTLVEPEDLHYLVYLGLGKTSDMYEVENKENGNIHFFHSEEEAMRFCKTGKI